MRAELLRKEKELILLKQQQISMQIQEEKRKMLQVTYGLLYYQTVIPCLHFITEINIDLFNVSM